MKVLELFCGTKSIGKQFNNVISVDIDEKFEPTITTDILSLDYKTLWQPGDFDYIHASPPCTDYSACNRGLINKVLNYDYYDKLVQRAIDIIEYLKPKYYTIENPQTGTLKSRPVILDWDKSNDFFDIDYCRFGFDYKKRTRFWSNIDYESKLCLKSGKCPAMTKRRHNMSIGNSKYATNVCKQKTDKQANRLLQRYHIPSKFLKELKTKIENNT